MRRTRLLVLLLLLAALTIPAGPGWAHSSQPAAAQPDVGVQADFNQDGFADLAVGAPLEDVGSIADAGAVNVLYGTAGGLSGTGGQLFTQVGSLVEIGDSFGEALATGDFNNDGFADLAAAAPFENVGNILAGGAVSVLYGSAGGLTTSGARLFTQVGSAVEPGDLFGFALASGDFNHDGFADLAAGAPGEDVGNIGDGGAVSILYGSAGGLTTSGARLFTQVGSLVEPGDSFGFALATGDFNNDGFADLAAAAPFEDVGNIIDGGAVSVLPGSAGGLTTSGARLFTQVGSLVEPGDFFGEALASGDFNNDGFADLAAGASGEDVGNISDGGAVSILYGSAGGLTTSGARLFTQVGSLVEPGDSFGEALATGDFNNDGFADLAAGAPSESVGNIVAGGAVSILPGSAAGLTTSGGRLFTQDSPGVPGVTEPFDIFGAALTADALNASWEFMPHG
jgi:hypothetical protein